MALTASSVLADINKIVDFIGLAPEQAAVDAWLIDKASTILNNLPAVPANLQPIVTLAEYSWYIDAGLPAPASLVAQVQALGGAVVAPTPPAPAPAPAETASAVEHAPEPTVGEPQPPENNQIG